MAGKGWKFELKMGGKNKKKSSEFLADKKEFFSWKVGFFPGKVDFFKKFYGNV